MKTLLFVLFIFCVTAAFGQAINTVSGEAHQLELSSHDLHASQHDLAPDQSIRIASAYTFGKGERPAWEFAPKESDAQPLGDAARALKVEHATAKKSEVVWVN